MRLFRYSFITHSCISFLRKLSQELAVETFQSCFSLRTRLKFQYSWASLVAQTVKNLPEMRETWVRPLSWEDPLEEGMASLLSILAWRIPTDREAWWATVHGVKSWAWLSEHTGGRHCSVFSTYPILFKWDEMRWLDSITESMDTNMSKLQGIVEDRGH